VSTTVDRIHPDHARSLAMHHPIGTSTGIFPEARGDWRTLVELACTVSAFAVELSALGGDELLSLDRYLAGAPRLPFRYVSVHAPTKGLATDERDTLAMLGRLPLWVRSVVTHPDVMADLRAYRGLGTRLVIENMDGRKAIGRTAGELEPFFEALPDAGFCLDIAHAHSLDRSLELAHELLDRYGRRLRQVHLSSLCDGEHVPVTAADARNFVPVLDRCRDVPWILEAHPPQTWHSALRPAPQLLRRAA
jgi:sugar phosphate isomerase/epimerase